MQAHHHAHRGHHHAGHGHAAAHAAGHHAPGPHAGAEHGLASYYGPGMRNQRTAAGGVFDPQSDTAAHRSLPLGTVARVTNLANGRSAVVTIRDRGPHTPGRILDVSPRIADALRMRQAGVARVMVEPLRGPGSLLVPSAAAAGLEELAEAPSTHPRPGRRPGARSGRH